MTTPIPTRYEALLQVCDAYVTQTAMANALGVSQPTVWRWINQTRQLPAEHVLQAEEDTGVSRHYLRPDIYPTIVHHRSSRFLAVDGGATRVSFNRGDILQPEFGV